MRLIPGLNCSEEVQDLLNPDRIIAVRGYEGSEKCKIYHWRYNERHKKVVARCMVVTNFEKIFELIQHGRLTSRQVRLFHDAFETKGASHPSVEELWRSI